MFAVKVPNGFGKWGKYDKTVSLIPGAKATGAEPIAQIRSRLRRVGGNGGLGHISSVVMT